MPAALNWKGTCEGCGEPSDRVKREGRGPARSMVQVGARQYELCHSCACRVWNGGPLEKPGLEPHEERDLAIGALIGRGFSERKVARLLNLKYHVVRSWRVKQQRANSAQPS